MVLKRDHREADVEALAKKFREDWSEGEVIRSWLRRHGEELRNLVRNEDWSWENIGKALSQAGIQFKTGKGLDRRKCAPGGGPGHEARKGSGQENLFPRQRQRHRQRRAFSPSPLPFAAPRPSGEPEFRIIQRGLAALKWPALRPRTGRWTREDPRPAARRRRLKGGGSAASKLAEPLDLTVEARRILAYNQDQGAGPRGRSSKERLQWLLEPTTKSASWVPRNGRTWYEKAGSAGHQRRGVQRRLNSGEIDIDDSPEVTRVAMMLPLSGTSK